MMGFNSSFSTSLCLSRPNRWSHTALRLVEPLKSNQGTVFGSFLESNTTSSVSLTCRRNLTRLRNIDQMLGHIVYQNPNPQATNDFHHQRPFQTLDVTLRYRLRTEARTQLGHSTPTTNDPFSDAHQDTSSKYHH